MVVLFRICLLKIHNFREIICDHLLEERKGKKIGGVGMEVEIDESLFGKR